MNLESPKEKYEGMMKWSKKWSIKNKDKKNCVYQGCQYQSGMKTDYTDHINAVHIQYSHSSCSFCEALFKTQKKLNGHLRNFHEDLNTKERGRKRRKIEEEFIEYSINDFRCNNNQ